MARTGITREQVVAAADALVEAGTAPTVQSVRARLGTGSFSTISGYLTEWRETHAERQTPPIPEPPELVGQALRTVWAQAWRGAQGAIAHERETLEASRQAMAAEREEMAAEIQRLEAQTEALGRELEIAREAQTQAHAQLQSQQVETARLSERNSALQTQLEETRTREQQARETVQRLQDELLALAQGAQKPPTAKAASR